MDKLGWHWWPAPNAISSRAFRNRPACQRYRACESGCPAGAKASADLTYWPDAIAAGAVLITGARVRSLTVDEKGLVSGAEFVDRDGRWHHQGAGLTILAANGVGTPRILLHSSTSAHPEGLANCSGLVGKRLMIHPYASVYGTYDADLESHLGPAGQSLQSLQFYETDESRGFVRGGKWNLMPTPSALNRVLWEPGTDWRDAFGSRFTTSSAAPLVAPWSGASPLRIYPTRRTRSSWASSSPTPTESPPPSSTTKSAITTRSCSTSTSRAEQETPT